MSEIKSKFLFIARTNPYRMGKTVESGIIEIKRQTQRSPAKLTITIPDKLAKSIIADELALGGGNPDPLNITGLGLRYDEK